MFWKSFFILSACRTILFLKAAKPSSRYKPMSFLLDLFESWWSRKLATNLHTSAPWYAPIVMYLRRIIHFFNCWLLKSKDFLEWLMTRLFLSEIYMVLQTLVLLLIIFGQKSLMSKITKLCRCLSWIAIKKSMKVLVFFHWLSCKFSQIFLFIWSKITLLIFPSSFFAGLISLTVRLFWKLSLWSFSDMKQLFSPFICILFKTLLLRKNASQQHWFSFCCSC